jgi:CheY-like chemotaxis protein
MKNLLIIDDSDLFRKKLKQQLVDLGFEKDFKIFEAENGLEALDVIKDNDIDVSTIDVDMPKMNGIEFLERLKKDFKKRL